MGRAPLFQASKTTVPAYAGTVVRIRFDERGHNPRSPSFKAYFFLAAFFLAFFFDFAMLALQLSG